MITCHFGINFAQLSPGDLHRSHAHLEGLSRCTNCHEIGNKDFSDRCLACHQILKARVEQGLGLHGKEAYGDCAACHVDHQGRDFTLIHWGDQGREAFDHRETGYALVGKHREAECRDCHQAKHIAAPESFKTAGKDLNSTFLGLETACITCHADIHGGSLGEDCASCHSAESWTVLRGFNHADTRFPLLGKHRNVACANCHAGLSTETRARPLSFAPLGFERCGDCHQDPHRGQFSPDCAACHHEQAWRPAPGFDHARSDFPLTGSHGTVACEACHRQEAGTVRYTGLAHETCENCHRDVHQDSLGSDCESCHDTRSWETYDKRAFSHDLTRFPLEGLHREVSCDRCHGEARGRRPLNFENCEDCHGDPHLGQLPGDAGCEACHDVNGFIPSSYTIQRHNTSGFPLSHSHLAIPCTACHREIALPAGITRRYRFPSGDCTLCHTDPHEGKATAAVAGDCSSCHSTVSWVDSVFDHDRTPYPLTGRHAAVPCKACHDIVGHGFHAPKACASCHQDPHFGQFSQTPVFVQSGCGGCHVTTDWLAEVFDHNRHARFPLEGAHAQTPCASCHLQERRNGMTFTQYRGTDARCEACHSQPSSGGTP